MPFIEIKSIEQWNELVSMVGGGNESYPIVTKMGAPWCGPCRAMTGPFKLLSNDYDSVIFVEIDIDKLPEIADKFEVTSIPTILVINNNEVVKRFVGGSSSVLSEIKGFINTILP